MMKMIKAIIRPEKVEDVLDALMKKGYSAATRMNVLGRGKQKGLKVGVTYYDEIPKEMIMIVVNDEDEEKVIKIIADSAKTGKNGTYGDGKIFISDVERAVTISSGENRL
ncbi:P-II family nitrogen regulator [Variimorphobacter saccharofermentans]